MFRHITVILLLLAFAIQPLQQALVVLDYYTHTAAYAKNCENKARPMLHCNGKCQMMKKLKEEEKKEQQNNERKLENKIEVLSSKSFFATFSIKAISTSKVFHTYHTIIFPNGVSPAIFHPPSLG